MRFRDLPIRQKLFVMTAVSSSTALLLASAGLLAWDVFQSRAEIRAELISQAKLVADNSGSALDFQDEVTADETLSALKSRDRVDLACLYRTDGGLFTQYSRGNISQCPPTLPSTPAGLSTSWKQFDILTNVVSKGKLVGTLYIRRDLNDLYDRLRVGLLTALGLLTLAFAAAFLIAARMQRSIATPLLHLADTARTISTSRDYSLRAVPASGDEVGVVVTAFNEMLDRIGAALENERDANRLKDEFLATLSHELRTPLNAVLGWARILRSAKLEPSTQARALESIERNAKAQARLIEDLLEISRIVTGKLRLQTREIDLAAIVDAAVEVVQPAAAAKRQQLTVETLVRPAMTSGDPDRLQQIVWNLLSNAVKFTPNEGQIAVRLERADGYRLSVRDTGPGIEPRFMPFVFEPFRQADGTVSREHGGLGLGLAIAKQLVELHGGTIEAKSHGSGTGATFEVQLPSVLLPPVGNIIRDDAEADLPSSDHMLDGLHVLVVDDEEDARLLLQTTLTQCGASVTLASSAQEALDAFTQQPPDVLLSDIGMPIEDGFTLMRRVRSRTAADGGRIPSIAITAYASAADRLATEAAGYHAHIAKPFDPTEVARLVRRLAGSHRAFAAAARS